MTPIKTSVILFLVFLFHFTGFAQKTNSQKILGCWVLKNMVIGQTTEYSEQEMNQAKNSVVCFSADGKFTTQLPADRKNPMKGTYNLSEDGKTIHQKREISDDATDDDAMIQLLDEKHLNLQIANGTSFYFERAD